MRDRLPSLRSLRVRQRTATTYRRVWLSNLLGHLADPLFYLAVLGFGLGSLMPAIAGMPYMTFLVTGLLAGAAMSSACFEASYASYLRMHSQRTFEAVLATPLSVADIAGGEILTAATKGLISTAATLAIAFALGLLTPGWWIAPVLAIVLLQGLVFAGAALAVSAHARTMEALNHFYALFIMPVLFVSGVFFPLQELPAALQVVSTLSPLTHAVHLIRPLATGAVPSSWPLELLWIALAAVLGVLLGCASLSRKMAR